MGKEGKSTSISLDGGVVLGCFGTTRTCSRSIGLLVEKSASSGLFVRSKWARMDDHA